MVGLVKSSIIDKNGAAPMFQLVFDTRLFKFTAEPPTCKPLLQLPPTIAPGTPAKAYGTHHLPYKIISNDLLSCYLSSITGECPGSPGRYAAGCSQERAAPMSQLVPDTRAYKFTAEPPTSKPLPQEPPTSA